ncbi:MAG: hypothetical protein ACKVW3_11745 [Phycisphaerales bacterium]
MAHRIVFVAWLVLWAFVLSVGIVGCVTPAQRGHVLAAVESQRAALDAGKAKAEAAVLAAQAANDVEALAKANADLRLVERLRAALDRGETTFSAVVLPDGSVDFEAAGTAVGALIGKGNDFRGGLIGAAIMAILAVAKVRTTSAALASTIQGIDAVSSADPTLNAALNAKWSIVEARLTPAARAAWDKHSST